MTHTIKYLDGREIKIEADSFLRAVEISRADLRDADLSRDDLGGADLRDADLSGADLSGAYLSRADLSGADLRDANLSGAYLDGANLGGAKNLHYQICPQEGAFIAYKKTHDGVIKIEIPAEAKRTSSMVGRKCRAEFVKTLGLPDGIEIARGWRDESTMYRVGEITRPDSYDDDPRVECTHGIHFFMTREEAEQW